MKLIYKILVLGLLVTSICACGKKNNEPTTQNPNIQEEKRTFNVIIDDILYKVNEGEKAIKPQDPTRDGYVFVGWFDQDGNSFDFDQVITKNEIITAKFEKVINQDVEKFNVTFKVDGEIIETKEVESGNTVSAISAPIKLGYTFKGWYLLDSLYDFDLAVTQNIELVGLYEVVSTEKPLDKLTITYVDSITEEVIDEIVITSGDKLVKPANPIKEGYEFLMWVDEMGIFIDFSMPVTQDMTIKAIFTTVSYSVSFYVDGKEVDYQTVEYNQTVTKPKDPVKSGYTFLGWYEKNTLFDFNQVITGNLTLTAKFEEIPLASNECFVYYNVDGALYKKVRATIGSVITPITAPAKSGYTFLGWYVGDTLYDFTTPITEETTFEAKYELIPVVTKYTVKFIREYDNYLMKSTQVEEGKTVSELTRTDKTGYTFIGYFVDDVEYDFTTPITKDTTIYVRYEKNTYTVTFVVDDTIYYETTSKYSEKVNDVPENPTKEGHKFVGWKNSDGTIIDTRSLYLYSNTTLTAIFEATDGSTEYLTPGGSTDTSNGAPEINLDEIFN